MLAAMVFLMSSLMKVPLALYSRCARFTHTVADNSSRPFGLAQVWRPIFRFDVLQSWSRV